MSKKLFFGANKGHAVCKKNSSLGQTKVMLCVKKLFFWANKGHAVCKKKHSSQTKGMLYVKKTLLWGKQRACCV